MARTSLAEGFSSCRASGKTEAPWSIRGIQRCRFRSTGQLENTTRRSGRTAVIRENAAGLRDLGHDDIQNDQIKFTGIFIKDLNCFRSVQCWDDAIPEFFQHFLGCIPKSLVVFSEENCLRAFGDWFIALRLARLGRFHAGGEIDAEGCPFSRLTV